MTHSLGKYLLAGLLSVASLGCEPRPVVVDPDDGDTTVIDDDADVVVPDGSTTQPETGVDVRVGGGEGVDVDVNPAQPGSSPSGASTDAPQNTTPNGQQ
jgi:hypothetical protein